MAALPPPPCPGRARRGALAALTVALAFAVACAPTKPSPQPDPLSLPCTTGVSRTSPDGRPLTVTYDTPTALGGTTPVSVSCAPASGTTFPIGATTVTCTASDALSRQATCSFTVMVTSTVRLQYTRFVAFGDSLTEGKLSRVYALVDFPESYTRYLQALLAAKYVSQSPIVINEGFGGEDTLTALRDRLPLVLTSRAPVEVLLLMHGANDLNKTGCSTYIAPAVENVRQMVRLAQGRGAVVFLAGLPPQRATGTHGLGAACVDPYNQGLRTVATSTAVPFIDVYAGFGGVASTDLVGADGLHLTEAGYHKIGDLFFEAIQARLEVKGP